MAPDEDFPDPRRCAYCAEVVPDGDQVEEEHVFPDSWYFPAELLPQNFAKPQVPSCGPCNRAFGAIEDRLRFRWGAALPLDGTPGRVGIWAGVQKGFTAKEPGPAGVTKKLLKSNDAKNRNRLALLNAMTVLHPDDTAPVLGNPETPPLWLEHRGVLVKGHPALDFAPEDGEAFGRKLVRGFSRYIWGRVLHKEQTIDPRMLVTKEDYETTRKVFGGWKWPMCRDSLGAGSLDLLVAADPSFRVPTSVWAFSIWGHYNMLVTVPDEIPAGKMTPFASP